MKRRRVVDSSDDESSDDGGPEETSPTVDLSDEKEEGPLAETKDSEWRFRPGKKAVLLTYPQSGGKVTKEQLRARLERLGAEQWIIVEEPHKDHGVHLHALVQFKSGKDSKNPAHLDVGGLHPNVKISRGQLQTETWIKYLTEAKKSGDPVDPDPLRNWSEYAPFIQAAMDGDVTLAEALVMKKDPMKYLVSGRQIRESLKRLSSIHAPTVRETAMKAESFQLDSGNILQLWDTEHELDREREFMELASEGDTAELLRRALSIASGKPMVLAGPSGIGKTELAKMIAKMWGASYQMVSHVDDLKKVSGIEDTVLIFDDMTFKHWNREANIHLVDTKHDRTVHARFYCVELRADRKMIFTCNNVDELFWSDPEFFEEGGGWYPKWMADKAIKRRIGLTVLFAENALYVE